MHSKLPQDTPSSTWLPPEKAQPQIPTSAWPLISHRHSLTEYLRRITNNKISFRLLFANWGHANSTERQKLNLNAGERTWLRCIEHCYQNTAWVHGRAIFPESTMRKMQETISGLGVQSLGDIIFKDPTLERSSFAYRLLDKINWARQSILYFQKQPILITEIFTPESYAHASRSV